MSGPMLCHFLSASDPARLPEDARVCIVESRTAAAAVPTSPSTEGYRTRGRVLLNESMLEFLEKEASGQIEHFRDVFVDTKDARLMQYDTWLVARTPAKSAGEVDHKFERLQRQTVPTTTWRLRVRVHCNEEENLAWSEIRGETAILKFLNDKTYDDGSPILSEKITSLNDAFPYQVMALSTARISVDELNFDLTGWVRGVSAEGIYTVCSFEADTSEKCNQK